MRLCLSTFLLLPAAIFARPHPVRSEDLPDVAPFTIRNFEAFIAIPPALNHSTFTLIDSRPETSMTIGCEIYGGQLYRPFYEYCLGPEGENFRFRLTEDKVEVQRSWNEEDETTYAHVRALASQKAYWREGVNMTVYQEGTLYKRVVEWSVPVQKLLADWTPKNPINQPKPSPGAA
ncbi:hypothetical protein B0J11DRAFT_508689 [Dendryphion nanum]|uniref:Uncharacterized protein n=1 Tax=Dendryphion nanum TaxID=256645 RepID=A0A9P9DIP9_9PLEO|nr:hypothetical protein B0J11DRAFT_508689 [Dendryphion nanum]